MLVKAIVIYGRKLLEPNNYLVILNLHAHQGKRLLLFTIFMIGFKRIQNMHGQCNWSFNNFDNSK